MRVSHKLPIRFAILAFTLKSSGIARAEVSCESQARAAAASYPGLIAANPDPYDSYYLRYKDKRVAEVTLHCANENRAASFNVMTAYGQPQAKFLEIAAAISTIVYHTKLETARKAIGKCFADAKLDHKNREGTGSINNVPFACGLSESGDFGESNIIFEPVLLSK